ncbi:peptidyl-prolyl cis-trans isomerase [Podospora conica]|nr:peptidyl-prolyl cis-trans isomerase [Schizothecium conicum]
MAGKKKDDSGKKSDAAGGKGAKGGGGDKSSSAKGGKGGDKAGTSTAKGAQSINVRHILCEKHSKKEEALAKLREGAKFDEVAKEFSEDKARQGGALGWKTKGSLAPEFEAVAYGLENSTTAAPKYGEAKTEFGYHVIMVEGRK